MQTAINTITINGVEYIEKGSIKAPELAANVSIFRSYAAGVFYGEEVSRKAETNGLNVVIKNARRVWYWSGAASLSQLATEGTKKPNDCKFPQKVASVELMNVVEILPVTKEALESLESVKVWKQ